MNEDEVMNNNKELASLKLATASMVLGIISLFSVFCCCPFIISAIGITLALVSKGTAEYLNPRAKTGLILSIVGLVISLCVVAATVLIPFVLANMNPQIKDELKQQYEDTLEQQEDLFRGLYGDDVYEDVLDSTDEIFDMF